ncbi:MAG: hypothetical protein PHY43_03530 [Verrucomicrobiales bacterium]|nr:hypothetical protein [Verrucomicrobiales bacterium]
MLQSLKKFSWILLLASGQQAAWAFSLGGPINNGGDNWQATTIGYGIGGDLTAPKNLGEEYRRNTPVMYWAPNANFLDFFGSNGVVAIDQAFTILNASLTNVNSYSSALTEFPLYSQAINYQASALGLLDLKSTTLSAMMEQLGLDNPVRYAWTLHNRVTLPGGTCPDDEVYLVVQRNFDFTTTPLNQVLYSPYVNATLYTYIILEACPASVPDPQALAAPVKVDPLADSRPSVASEGLQTGGYYISLTRDDIGGLRYMLNTNNINFESSAPGSVLLSSTVSGGTNYGAPFPLYTSNYTAFALAARTNDPVTMSNLFPGLVIVSSSNYFTMQATPTIVAYFTNLIGAPAGSQTLVITTNYTYTVVTNYVTTFANVVTNNYRPNSSATLVTVQVQQLAGAPAGTLTTNTTSKNITLTNVPSGDYYINTNACGPNLILSTLFTNVVVETNLIISASNSAGLFYSQSLVTRSTNHIFVAEPIICGAAAGGTTNAAGLYQGIGKIKFVKTSFDSLLGQFYQPITNTYTMQLVSNSKLVNQTFQRVVTTPDFLFSAADLADGPAELPNGVFVLSRNVNFNQANILPGLAGPGTIDPATTITFDKVGTIFENIPDGDQLTGGLSVLTWGSFDGSTNAPVVYPNGTSIENLANQVLVQISPASLPVGTNGVAYPATTFIATGGAFSPPFDWSLSSGSLPSGLTLSSGGTISGTPTQTGTFDFTLQLTDVVSRSVQWNYSLIIQ